MMVRSVMAVECSEKIAMTALRGDAGAMTLLRDCDGARCILLRHKRAKQAGDG
jgi:hypothetical protein